MRYADFKERKAELDKAMRAYVNNPTERRRFELERDTCRAYQLTADIQVFVNPAMVEYGSLLTIQSVRHGHPVQLTSAILDRAADVARHVEAWMAGTVSDLAPSGTWASESTGGE